MRAAVCGIAMLPAVAWGCGGAPGPTRGASLVAAPPETTLVRIPAIEDVVQVHPIWSVSLEPLKLRDGSEWWPGLPVAVALSDSLIGVLDAAGGETALVRAKDGVALRVFGGLGQGPGEYFGPHDIVPVPGGFLVADPTNRRLGLVDPSGAHLGTVGVPGVIRLAVTSGRAFGLTFGTPPALLALGADTPRFFPVDSVRLRVPAPPPSIRGMAVLRDGSVALPIAPDQVLLVDAGGNPRRLLRVENPSDGLPIRAVAREPTHDLLLIAAGPSLLCVDVSSLAIVAAIRLEPAPGDAGLYPIQAINASETAAVVLETLRPRVSLVPSPCQRRERVPATGL